VASPVHKGVRDYSSYIPTATTVVVETSTTYPTTGTYTYPCTNESPSTTKECTSTRKTSSSTTRPPIPTTTTTHTVTGTWTKTDSANYSYATDECVSYSSACVKITVDTCHLTSSTKSWWTRPTTTKWIDTNNHGLVLGAFKPWQPIGACGLAKWVMADKGDPVFGVKKDIVGYTENYCDYEGFLQDGTLLDNDIRSGHNVSIVPRGDVSPVAICNQTEIVKGMEGYIRGSFIWRYNLENPNNKILDRGIDRFVTKVGDIEYPTFWKRIVVDGVQKNSNNEVNAVLVRTKYGINNAGVSPYAIRENNHDGSSWDDTSVVLSESPDLLFENEVALIPLSNLYDHSDFEILLLDPTPCDSADAFDLSDVTLKVGGTGDLSYPIGGASSETMEVTGVEFLELYSEEAP
jgi:hypothetical protein